MDVCIQLVCVGTVGECVSIYIHVLFCQIYAADIDSHIFI